MTDYKDSCTIRYRATKYLPYRNKVTSILVIPFVDEENIVLTINPRWIDIPWGHLEPMDITFEDCAYRETLEESWAEIQDLEYLWALESDYFWDSQDKLTYILVYSAKVNKLNEYNGNMECSGRKIMSYEDFLSVYKWKIVDNELMRFLIECAISMKS